MKYQLTVLLVLFLCIIAQGQNVRKYYYVDAGTGGNGFLYSLTDNSRGKINMGCGISGGCCFPLLAQCGIKAGAGIKSYQSTGRLDYTLTTASTDEDGDSYELHTKFDGWKESQYSFFVHLPVGFYYLHRSKKYAHRDFKFLYNSWNNLGFLFTGGLDLSLPVYSWYRVRSGTIETTGYYPQWDAELADMPQHGFTTYSDKYSGKLKLHPSVALFGEVGRFYGITFEKDLYIGFYFSYSLNNVVTAGTESCIENGEYTGLLGSSLSGEVKPVSFGIKVGLFWHREYSYK